MESPLSIFSPDSYPLSFNDEYPLSPFGLEVEPTSSFASFSGLAEQLCYSSSSPTSSQSSSSYLPPPSSYASAGQGSTTLDELFGKDLYSDFSSDDDFFTPTFSVTDLPSPSPNRSDYYPSTPPPPSFSLAPPLAKSGSSTSDSSSNWNAGLPSSSSWDQQQNLCNPVEVCYPSIVEQSWMVNVDEGCVDSSTEVGSEWSYPESLTAPAPRLSNKASMESLGEWDGVENVPESWTTDATFYSNNTPAWSTSAPSPPPSTSAASTTSTTSSPPVYQRAPTRARSNPSIQPSTPRSRLPAKASMPALKEEAADDAYSYVFDGGAPSNDAASLQSSMFAVLGGYGGEEQSLGQEWNGRTVGRDAYGGGWSAGPSQRFEVENSYPGVMPTRMMGGGAPVESYEEGPNSMGLVYQQQQRSVSSSVPSSPGHSQVYQSEYSSPSPHSSPRSFSGLATPPKLSRRVSPITPTLIAGRTGRPSTAPSLLPLLSTGPLAPRRASGTPNPSSASSPRTPKSKVPSSKRPMLASLARAQAVVQMRQQEQDREREEYRRTAAERKVDPFLASVLIQGWEPSAESAAALIVQQPSTPRPIARLPSPRSYHVPTTPSPTFVASQPQKIQRPAIEAPIPVGGYTTFINYTMADAESLLMGVAPSGAPQPRKPSSSPKKKRSGEDLAKEGGKRRA